MRTNRLVCMVMAAAMFASAAVAETPSRKAGDKGTFIGKVIEKSANSLSLKNDAGESQKFTPNWVGGLPKDAGSFDKIVVGKIKDVHVGDKVEIKWEFQERLRMLDLTVLEKARE